MLRVVEDLAMTKLLQTCRDSDGTVDGGPNDDEISDYDDDDDDDDDIDVTHLLKQRQSLTQAVGMLVLEQNLGKSHNWYTAVTLLSHSCHTVITMRSHCYYTVIPLLLHTVVTLLLHYDNTVIRLLRDGHLTELADGRHEDHVLRVLQARQPVFAEVTLSTWWMQSKVFKF
jgi:hypothetical protein